MRLSSKAAGVALALVLLGGSFAAAWSAPTRVAGGIRFTYADPNANTVAWAGAFNGWNATATPMAKGADGVWSVVVPLPEGAQEYKIVVDGQWVADPENTATSGEYGNSVVQVAANGDLVAIAPTSNTPYSAKILVGGRVIGLYQSIRSTTRDRFELRRPDMDIDLDFGIRISEVLRARFLTNIRSEVEDVEFYRSRLNFDRGHLEFTQPRLRIFAYDNEAAGTWDDPLHLVGDVGIYHHPYGYGRQGFRLDTDWHGVRGEMHYADNFETGSEAFPTLLLDGAGFAETVGELPVVPDGSGGHALASGGYAKRSVTDHSDRNEDMTAARFTARPLAPLRLGLLARADRGYNLGFIHLVETTGPDRFRHVQGTIEEQWYALGGEARWDFRPGLWAEAEYLRGTQRFSAVQAVYTDYLVTSNTEFGPTGYTFTGTGGASDESRDLEHSHRFTLGGGWTAGHGDITLRGGVEIEDHDYSIEDAGLDNRLVAWRLGWDRNWRYYLNREVKTTLDLELNDFDYDPATPWGRQLWFAPAGSADRAKLTSGNFWLEHDEHRVSFDRITLLGGEDVVSVRPRVQVPLRARRNVTFDYEGVFNVAKLGRLPKYSESVFRLGFDVTRFVRFSTDSRWAKYDDPTLGLFHGYVDHFAQLSYAFAPTARVELSFGVDPWVIDPPANEFAMIGRDQFLFDANRSAASPTTALVDFVSLGARVAAAEKALRDERRVQVRGIVTF
jgi:hypothetical protein